MIFTSSSTEETLSFGKILGEKAPPGTLFALFGDLGVGKTTLVKGIVLGVTGTLPENVTSPTYIYLHAFSSEKRPSVYHFDLYRLRSADEFLALGFDEYLREEEAICCIEWSERIASFLPKTHIPLYLSHVDENKRKIEGLLPWFS